MTYVTQAERRSIEARATANDQSTSEWLREAAHEKIERDDLESKTERFRIEERILDLVDDSAERAAQKIVEELKQNDDLDQEENPYADWGE